MLVKPFQPAAGQKGSGVTPRSATPQRDTEVQLLKPKPVPEVIYPLPSLRNTRLWSNISRSFPHALPEHAQDGEAQNQPSVLVVFIPLLSQLPPNTTWTK